MTENTLIRFGLSFALLCFACPVKAQNTPEKDTRASDKDKPSGKSAEASDTAEKKGDKAKKGKDAQTKIDKKAPAPEESAGKTDGEEDDDLDAEVSGDDEEEMEKSVEEDDEDLGASEEDEEEDEDLTSESPAELRAPKTVELDMSALGKMDPEKELAEGGPVEESEAVDKKDVDWTERKMDILELHGYFRVRPELYHRFNVRSDDAVYNLTAEQRQEDSRYKNSTLTGANMRFRLEPTLNISESIRVKSQMDFLDNVMLGSTPRYWQGFGYGVDSPTTMQIGRVQGWDMGPPGSSQMVVVRRAWGEVMTPLGELRFGRMGDHWGTGMLHNAGNGIQNDFGDSVDRIMFAAKINNWLIAPAFDFPNEGMSSWDASGRPFDVSQLDDAYRLVGMFAYKHDEEEQKAMLRRGDWLINTGLYFSYRWQILSYENKTQSSGEYDPALDETLVVDNTNTSSTTETPPDYYQFYKRELWEITPDLWFQLLWKTFHLELEVALIGGRLGNPSTEVTDEISNLTLLQWGGVLQIDYGLLSDALRIGAEFGYAQGDKEVNNLRAPSTYDQRGDDNTFNAFSFNPAYNIDLILHRHILGSVSQSFYLDAFLKYDFLKNEKGRKLGVRADVLYSRAIFKESVIGDSANLGVELNAQINYLSEDGFLAGFAYGVLFPLGAFKGDPDGPEGDRYENSNDLSVPQTIQMILGIVF